jgi:hypothetical protein
MADSENIWEIRFSKQLVERAQKERRELLRQIEESQKTITRSREIIAQLNAILANRSVE